MGFSNTNSPVRLCILGGLNGEISPSLKDQADVLAVSMAEVRIGLTCMGNAGKLITRIAKVTKAHGGHITCVIPSFAPRNERLLRIADEQMFAKDIHENKMFLFNLSHGLIVLPGGLETLDILTEYLTWIQRVHRSSKPVYLVDEGHFWEPLLRVFDHMQNELFLPLNFHTRYKLVVGLGNILSDFQHAYRQ